MQTLATWLFRSPRRLGLVLLSVAGLTLGLGVAWTLLQNGTLDPSGSHSGRPAAISASVGGALAPGGEAGAGSDLTAKAYLTAAVTFTNTWARLAPGQSPAQWHEQVRRLATTSLARGLDATDPATLPGGGVAAGAALQFVSATSALVRVPLTSGSAVLVTVVHDGQTWLVSDVQPDVGN